MISEIRKLSPNDGMEIYEMLQRIPREENGFHNNGNGLSVDEFCVWLKKKDEQAKQVGLADGWKVPSTTYWLYVDGRPVGMGSVRHFLTDALRMQGGHIGYAIAPEARGKGYAKILLRGLLDKAARLGIERALITVKNENIASIRTALSCGGVIESVNEERHLIWAECVALE